MNQPHRRNVLIGGLTAAMVATWGAILYPVLRFLRPRAATASGALEVVAPFRVKEILQAKNNPFDFGGKPCLVVLTPDGAKRLAAGQAIQADDLRAFNAVCTHVDCTVKYRQENGDIYCACHEGIYDLNGRNVSGPPPRPLEAYVVTLRGEPGQEEIVVSKQSPA
ncbi:MAG: plastoquinol--plastocyanin reductase [Planctomycetota bacterium]|nr:MAG: plastoquinol--plastocyanin reductase [Planctomycetota bacterium]